MGNVSTHRISIRGVMEKQAYWLTLELFYQTGSPQVIRYSYKPLDQQENQQRGWQVKKR